MEKTYIAIDLKSFYASVECAERGLDPLTTNLVVADASRTEKTICLAVSPSLKSYGIPGRPRLFEVVQKAKEANMWRKGKAPGGDFTGKSYFFKELSEDPSLAIDYIVAPPRMSLYMKYSTDIFGIYLKYISADDIHVYSCDEVFMDVTSYLQIYNMTPHELAMTMIREVLKATGITATAGIGTNLYLCKIAMDIVAKHMPADKDGVRIAELDEMSYRKQLWNHTPLTDFWRVGRGTAKRLAHMGIYTMGDIAQASLSNEESLYHEFGINAELLIDHAWGWEPVTIAEIKSYRPENNSLSSGQVLSRPYSYEEGLVVLKEMADSVALDLVSKGLVTRQVVLTVNYASSKNPELFADLGHTVAYDHYGRFTAKPAHGTKNLGLYTSSSSLIIDAFTEIYEANVDKRLGIKRFNLGVNFIIPETKIPKDNEGESGEGTYEQMSLFSKEFALSPQGGFGSSGTFFIDQKDAGEERKKSLERLQKEKNLQLATLKIKEKYGKNAILKGTDYLDGATARERNSQIGGHKA